MGRLLTLISGFATLFVALFTVPKSTFVTNVLSWVPSRPIVSPFADSILFAGSVVASSILLGVAAIRPSRQALLNQISALRDQMVALRIELLKDYQGLIAVKDGERQYRDLKY